MTTADWRYGPRPGSQYDSLAKSSSGTRPGPRRHTRSAKTRQGGERNSRTIVSTAETCGRGEFYPRPQLSCREFNVAARTIFSPTCSTSLTLAPVANGGCTPGAPAIVDAHFQQARRASKFSAQGHGQRLRERARQRRRGGSAVPNTHLSPPVEARNSASGKGSNPGRLADGLGVSVPVKSALDIDSRRGCRFQRFPRLARSLPSPAGRPCPRRFVGRAEWCGAQQRLQVRWPRRR